ncbi:hypothetical protein JYU04_02455 [Dehalococcoides mccartyi]|nr:hypothetical protein [Dehalococcoides mccartyi]
MPHLLTNRTRTVAIVIVAIVFSFALLTAANGDIRPAMAGDAFAFTVIEQSIDIDYGNKITITSIIEADDTSANLENIESVRALFRPRGGSTVWSYSYPEFSPVGSDINRLSVTFDIPTGLGSYYPPGTEFDINIEVTGNTGGTASVVSTQAVEYLDPANEWERVEGDGYTVIYYGVSRSAVEELVATVDHRIPTLEATLGVTDPPDFKAIVFPSIKAATPSFPPVSQTATDQFLFAGFAQPQYRLFVQGQMNSTTFTHELAHLYTHEATSASFLAGVPSWLGEGLSRFLETGSSERSNERLRESVRPDELLSLKHMQTVPGQRSDVFIFYPQAGAFVGYLVEEYSHETMADFLAMLNKGRSIQDAFELIYDKTLYEVENDWRALFKADALPIPSATVESGDAGEIIVDTQVPLIDYESLNTGAPHPTSTVAPASLPTVTPRNLPEFPSSLSDGQPTPNWTVAGLIIGLSVITGIWLFTSRRRMPKRKS